MKSYRKDISISASAQMTGCDAGYTCTTRDCVVEKYEERYFKGKAVPYAPHIGL